MGVDEQATFNFRADEAADRAYQARLQGQDAGGTAKLRRVAALQRGKIRKTGGYTRDARATTREPLYVFTKRTHCFLTGFLL